MEISEKRKEMQITHNAYPELTFWTYLYFCFTHLFEQQNIKFGKSRILLHFLSFQLILYSIIISPSSLS